MQIKLSSSVHSLHQHGDPAGKRPMLPQDVDAAAQKARAFEISVAKTAYNYMFSYLEPLSIGADVPKNEKFTLEYEAKVLEVFIPLMENFFSVLVNLLEKEIVSDLPSGLFKSIEEVNKVFDELKQQHKSHNAFKFIKEIEEIKELLAALSDLPNEIDLAVKGLEHIPKDIKHVISGLREVIGEFKQEGVTAFLKNAIYDTLASDRDANFLSPKSVDEYVELFHNLPLPLNLKIEKKDWMPKAEEKELCQQDWYFGYMQIAGFNTSILKGVTLDQQKNRKSLVLSELLRKMPLTDQQFQSVSGEATLTLEDAARAGHLYAVDYAMFEGIPGSELHDQKRYPCAPIALFYWNAHPPAGFPPSGALQPIAIQLGQTHNSENTPVFTPNDCTNNNDHNGVKWKIAKFMVQNTCAIQHETVAHLGACHLTVEPMIIASNRQFACDHPLLVLLKPHFRFTLEINDSALHSLVVPGGVVNSVLSTGIVGSAELIVDAFNKWRFDDQFPDRLFKDRAVSEDELSSFPFREDTLDLWSAINKYVREYLELYYTGDNNAERSQKMLNDYELQNWVNEMTNPKYAAVKGMRGLTETGDPEKPYQLDDFDYFVKLVSLIIYTGSAQHASVNYAQFPLMSYLPSVSGTAYRKPPSKSETLEDNSYLEWLPPLDVALYQMTFGYLLSGVQFDTLGYFTNNNRKPYFTDPRVQRVLADFQLDLKKIEVEIHKRNDSRPFIYNLQLPSIVPNSISI
ncbi:MAG: arachidonate 15-lipoxygenase [Gammaproteobacteria bacterium]|nr:arachidonate 15-lipoxygenase [Gammaproteobacteria bacterium]